MTIKGFPRFGLRGRLLAGALILIMIPVLSVGYWVNYRVEDHLRQEALQENG